MMAQSRITSFGVIDVPLLYTKSVNPCLVLFAAEYAISAQPSKCDVNKTFILYSVSTASDPNIMVFCIVSSGDIFPTLIAYLLEITLIFDDKEEIPFAKSLLSTA